MNQAAQDIIRAARNNPAITSAGLVDEMQRGDISGWLHLDSVRWGNFANWTSAMDEAAQELARIEQQKARAQARRTAK
jgi:hypothetical protein